LQALDLSDDQLVLLKAAWHKTSADKSALLQQHIKLAARLLKLQQAAEQCRQQFARGMQAAFQRHYCYYLEPCAALWLQQQEQQQQQQIWQEQYAGTPAGLDPAAAAAMPVEAFLGRAETRSSAAWQQRHAACQQSCSQAGSYSIMQPTLPHLAAAAAAADSRGAATRQTCSSSNSQASSVSGSTSWQDKAAAAAAGQLATDPDLLLDSGTEEQQRLEQQMRKVLNSAALLYFTQHLQLYNVLSRKQLAAAAVASWPWQFDPMAVCEALEDMGWEVLPDASLHRLRHS
jgi:hypothetical protein